MKTPQHLLLALIAVFAPVKAAVLTAIVLVLADLITGLMAAHKRGDPITSSGIKTTVAKIMLYEVAILLGFLVQHYLTEGILPVCNLITSVIGLTEITSILENLQTINPAVSWTSLVSRFTKTKDQI